MLAFLLAPLESFAGWLLSFFLGWALDKIKASIQEAKDKKEQEISSKKTMADIEAVDKKIETAKPEELDALRREKIALEESLFNSTP